MGCVSVTPAGGDRPEAAAENALPVRTKPGDASRYAQLEGQRGIAAVAVVVFHAYQYDRVGVAGVYPYEGTAYNAFFLGLDGMVSWFFVLSAFLLSVPYVRAVVDGRPATSARRFLARRAVRIVPLYLIAVLVVWAWRNPGLPGNWQDLVEHLTFTQVFDRERIFFTIGPAWSLAVEVQFYLLLAVVGGLAARAGTRMASRRRRVLMLWLGTLGLAAVSAGYAAFLALVLDRPKDDFHLWFSLPVKLVIFAAGIAVAVLVTTTRLRVGRPTTWVLRAGAGVVVLLAMYTRELSGGGDAWFHGLCGLGFALLVLASVAGPQDGLFHRLLTSRLLVWLGLVSYSLYLWHEPLLLSLAGLDLVPDQAASAFPLTAGVLVVTGLVVAWASYWLIEYPASHLRTRIDGGTTPPAPIADTRPRREQVRA